MTVYTLINICLYVAGAGIVALAYGYAKEHCKHH